MSEVPLYHTQAVLGLLAFGADPPAAHRDLEIDRGDRAVRPVSADGLICKHLKCFDMRTAMQHTFEGPISVASTKFSITVHKRYHSSNTPGTWDRMHPHLACRRPSSFG